jgi:hypothetical protein
VALPAAGTRVIIGRSPEAAARRVGGSGAWTRSRTAVKNILNECSFISID